MLAAGNVSGADELDLYDVACLVWSWLDEAVTATQFTGRNLKKSAELREQLLGMQTRRGGSLDEVNEFRRLLNRTSESETPDGDPAGELAALAETTSQRSRLADDAHP